MPLNPLPLRPLQAALAALALGAALLAPAQAAGPRTVGGLQTPESVLVTADGRVLVSEIAGFGQDGDGRISRITPEGRVLPLATRGLNDPKGLAERQGVVYVADVNRIVRVDRAGVVAPFLEAHAFPQKPRFLNDLAVGPDGHLYVSDSGELLSGGGGGAIYRIAPDGTVALIVDESMNPAIRNPNGLLVVEGGRSLLVVDFGTGELLKVRIADGQVQKLAEGFGGGDGLALDSRGRLIVSDWKNGRVFKLDKARKGAKPVAYPTAFKASADLTLSADGQTVLVPDMKAGTLVFLPK